MDNSSLMVMKWYRRWYYITKKLLSPLSKTLNELLYKTLKRHTKLEDTLDTRMKNILSQYIQAKRDHEYMVNESKQKE